MIFFGSSSSYGYNQRKTRQVMIDRLHHLSTSSYQDQVQIGTAGVISLDVVTKDEIEMYNFAMIDCYCSLLVILSDQELNEEQRSEDDEEMKQLFPQLLFTSTFSF
jgi:hypothetical protein